MKKSNCLAMILAGGKGSRLGVLTKDQAKPGLLFGGKYRIIDFPLSNCRNSGIDTVGILTQYQPLELNWYIGNGSSWNLDSTKGGTYVLPPYQSDGGSNWYRGTADAIYQNLNFVEMVGDDYVLILSGDHIYSFDRDVMESYLKADAKDEKSEHDFGKNVIPAMLGDKIPLYAYPFEGYWKDVGTIDSLWQANMDLIADEPPIDLRDSHWRIYSGNQSFPPHLIGPKGSAKSSLIAEGSEIFGTVSNSVIFYGVTIKEGAKVTNSVIMPGTVVEENAVVDKAILGERCHIYPGAVLHNEDGSVAVLGRKGELKPEKVTAKGEH